MRRREQIEERKKLFMSVVAMFVVAALIVLFASNVKTHSSIDKIVTKKENSEETLNDDKTITLWYYDNNLQDYIEAVSEKYEKNSKIKVQVKKVEYDDYAEKINNANISGKKAPDLFIGSSLDLEKMYLAGLCDEISTKYTDKDFSNVAIESTIYEDKRVAYPLCFDTAFMVYNTKYTGVVPKTFDELLDFCDEFNGEKFTKVRSILEWDVNDVMFNYGFAGSYIGCPDMPGNDYDEVVASGKNINEAMKYYKKLSQFFSIKDEDVNYDKVKKDFKDGKLVYAIVKSDFINYMKNSKTKYRACVFPDLTKKLATKALSETTVIYVSPFSKNSGKATDFAKYMTENSSLLVNDLTPYVSAKRLEYKSSIMNEVYAAYEKSTGESKNMNYTSFKTLAQIAIKKIWNGANIKETLKEFENSLL